MKEKILHFFVFSNLYLSLGTILMCFATYTCLGLVSDWNYCFFVVFSTMCSYCLHWALTEGQGTVRLTWTARNRQLLFAFFGLSSLGILCLGFHFWAYWHFILPLVVLTFLYTAPKIPYPIFVALRGFAWGKTFYLALVWTLVTVVLPILIANSITTYLTAFFYFLEEKKTFFFVFNRFLLFFLSCILFDYKDKKEDEGIKNLITYLNEKGLNYFFYACVLCFFYTIFRLWVYFDAYTIFALCCPALLLVSTFEVSKNTKNDLWFFLFLDGLMFLTGGLLLK